MKTSINEIGFLTEAQHEEMAAESDRIMKDTFGAFKNLDAYPWVANADDDRDHGVPREAVQERRDTFEGQNGQASRYWRVEGRDDLGLPRIWERDLHVELLIRTVTAGLDSGKIEYAYRDLVPYLRLKPSQRSYERVDLALDRLFHTHITFLGRKVQLNQGQDRVDATFKIVANFGTVTEGGEPFGFLQWGEGVCESLKLLVKAHHANFTPDDESEDEARVSELRQLIRGLITPTTSENTNPG